MNHLRLWIGLNCLVISLGCQSNEVAYKAAKVSGTVTVDGMPIETGVINFMSAETTGPAGEDSAEIKAGKFAATKVPVGNVRMYIIASKETGKMIKGSSTDIPETVSIIPPHYAQGIEATISGDETDRKIDLRSTPQ